MNKIIIFVFILFASLSSIAQEYEQTASGLQYKFLKKGNGEPLQKGHFVKASLIIFLKDSILFNSYDMMPYYNRVDSAGQPYDYSELFLRLHDGDSLEIVQSADTFLKKGAQLPPIFKQGDLIKSYFKILQVFHDESSVQADYSKYQKIAMEKQQKKASINKQKELAEIRKYIASNKIIALEKKEGVFVEVLRKGTGPIADSAAAVGVFYTGKLFDGTVFDSNVDPKFNHTDTLKFVIDAGQMIQGFNAGVKNLRQGSKVRLYIPSTLGYGENGSGLIKPNSNLIFDIELASVKPAPKPKPSPAKQPVRKPAPKTMKKN